MLTKSLGQLLAAQVVDKVRLRHGLIVRHAEIFVCTGRSSHCRLEACWRSAVEPTDPEGGSLRGSDPRMRFGRGAEARCSPRCGNHGAPGGRGVDWSLDQSVKSNGGQHE